jgi:transposase
VALFVLRVSAAIHEPTPMIRVVLSQGRTKITIKTSPGTSRRRRSRRGRHFLIRRLPKVATEMALHVLAYNLTRVMNIMGVKPLIAAMKS